MRRTTGRSRWRRLPCWSSPSRCGRRGPAPASRAQRPGHF